MESPQQRQREWRCSAEAHESRLYRGINDDDAAGVSGRWSVAVAAVSPRIAFAYILAHSFVVVVAREVLDMRERLLFTVRSRKCRPRLREMMTQILGTIYGMLI